MKWKEYLNLIKEIELEKSNEVFSNDLSYEIQDIQNTKIALDKKYNSSIVENFVVVSRGEANVNIYENKKNILIKIDPHKDQRFTNVKWKNKFDKMTKIGKNISDLEMNDIKKWLKAISKLKAFM